MISHVTKLGLFLMLIFLSFPNVTFAEGASNSRVAQARVHVEAGQEAFDDREYERAISEFQQAYDLVENTMLLYNIALAYERLDQLREAIDYYNQYLAADPDAENADDVRETVEDLHRERVRERDEPLEVEAADEYEGSGEERQSRRIPLVDSRHELGLALGTAIGLNGIRTAGDASLSFEAGYHFRINSTWHVGASFLMDRFGLEAGDIGNQEHYGATLGGRWAHQLIDGRLEIRAFAKFGYLYIPSRTIENSHWIFLRFGGSVAFDIVRGFGVFLDLAFRMGYVAGFPDSNRFGVTFDAMAGVFFAF